jgi:hypothetical protein
VGQRASYLLAAAISRTGADFEVATVATRHGCGAPSQHGSM